MSCFMVSDLHIASVVTWAAARGRLPRGMDCQNLADVLRAQNVESVAHRYNAEEPALMLGADPTAPVKIYHARKLTAVEAIKAAQCVNYQCCETPNYGGSAVERALLDIISAAIRELPGYEDAAWSIEPVEPVRG